jgi:hypothetical protein
VDAAFAVGGAGSSKAAASAFFFAVFALARHRWVSRSLNCQRGFGAPSAADLFSRSSRGGRLMSRAHHSKPTPRDCEDEQCRSEGSESRYHSPDEGNLFFIIIVRAMKMRSARSSSPNAPVTARKKD